MKKGFLNKGWIGLVACLLCVLTVCQTPARAAEATLDYGRGVESDKSLSASALFSAIFGETEVPLSEAEKNALDALSGVALQYNDSVPPQLVERSYNGDLGVFTVRAQSYDYVAQNGETVSWVPVRVSLNGGEKRSFDEKNELGEYSCAFGDIWNSDEIQVDVDYAWQVEIPVETADGLLTLPYTVGREALEALNAYNAAKSQYDGEKAAYDAYLSEKAAYDEAKTAFLNYNDALAAYTAQKSAYDAYVIDKALYDSKVLAFEAYKEKKNAYDEALAAFYLYEQKRQEYATLYDQYEPYLKGVADMEARLAIMESMFLYDSNGWQFYGGVMGGTVDSVIANRYKLETVALVERKYIDNAKNATEQLRPLLQGYAELRKKTYNTTLERQQALFGYYSEHYEEIRDSVTLLYQSVHTIYGNSAVVKGMSTDAEARAKQPKFRWFLAHLYLLYCALDASAEPNLAWILSEYDKKTYMELVEEKLLPPTDVNPSPAGVYVPETTVELPDDLPEPVEKPIKDFEDVEDPSVAGAPTYVENPGDPPPEVEDPGDPPPEVDPPTVSEPTPPTLSSEARALAEAIRLGTLQSRAARNTSQTLMLEASVTRFFTIDNRKTVSFYDHEGNLLQTVLVEYGESVVAPDVSRQPDEVYTSHVFLGWLKFGDTDINNRVSLQSVTTDLILVPKYASTKRIYEITWVVDGKVRTTTYHWGELPECPLSTEKAADSTVEYRFTGWSPAVTEVRENATYTAQYEETPRLYKVTWRIADRVEETWLRYGETPVCGFSTDRATTDRIYTFTGWDQTVRPVKGDVTYTAQYKETLLATYNDASPCPIEHNGKTLTLLAEQEVVCISNLYDYARKNGMTVYIQWGELAVVINDAAMQTMDVSRCTKLKMEQKKGAYEDSTAFTVTYLNDAGKQISVPRKISVTAYYTPEERSYAMVYRAVGSVLAPIEITRYTNGSAEMKVDSGVPMEFRLEYRLGFTDPNEKCDLSAFSAYASASVGAQIPLRANCEYGYEIAQAVIRYADGREVTVTEDFFIMEKDIVSVEVQVLPITYWVRFVVDGEVILEQSRFFGEAIEIPADPVKGEDETYFYTFAGWTPNLTGATTGENRSPVYTASFSRTPKVPAVSPEEPVVDRFMTVMVPILCGVGVLLLIGVALLILFRRRLKRRLLPLWTRVVAFWYRLFPKKEENKAVEPKTQAEDTDTNEHN